MRLILLMGEDGELCIYNTQGLFGNLYIFNWVELFNLVESSKLQEPSC